MPVRTRRLACRMQARRAQARGAPVPIEVRSHQLGEVGSKRQAQQHFELRPQMQPQSIRSGQPQRSVAFWH